MTIGLYNKSTKGQKDNGTEGQRNKRTNRQEDKMTNRKKDKRINGPNISQFFLLKCCIASLGRVLSCFKT